MTWPPPPFNKEIALNITHKRITIPAVEPTPETRSFPVAPQARGAYRVANIRVTLAGGESTYPQRVFLSQKVGGVYIDAFGVAEATPGAGIGYTPGSDSITPEAPEHVVCGSLDNAVGDADAPLHVIFGNGKENIPTGEVVVDLVLAHD